MNVEKTLKELKAVMTHWPEGSRVWHRGSGQRGVVIGWLVSAGNVILIDVDYGNKGGITKELTCVLSGVPVSDGTDGEEWKDGEEGAGV